MGELMKICVAISLPSLQQARHASIDVPLALSYQKSWYPYSCQPGEGLNELEYRVML